MKGKHPGKVTVNRQMTPIIPEWNVHGIFRHQIEMEQEGCQKHEPTRNRKGAGIRPGS
jgi:hypothetical protein